MLHFYGDTKKKMKIKCLTDLLDIAEHCSDLDKGCYEFNFGSSQMFRRGEHSVLKAKTPLSYHCGETENV